MSKTYVGGCHCGTVRYEAEVDLSQGTIRCNCSMCAKGRAWLAAVDPAKFRLLSGAEALSEYRFGANRIRHLFCRTCGVKSFARGSANGKEFAVVVVSCLENVTDEELAAMPVLYVNGRNDDFTSAPSVTSHL